MNKLPPLCVPQEEGEHAEFSPSASKRWLACPASIPMSAGLLNGSSLAAVRGTAMHWLADYYLKQGTEVDDPTKCKPQEVRLTTKFNGASLEIPPADWMPHVLPYVRAVRAEYDNGKMLDDETQLLTEVRVNVHKDLCWGSCDAAVVVPGIALTVFDLKTGGKLVDPSSPQCLIYLLGLAIKYAWQFQTYTSCIAQDANGAADNIWRYTVTEKELKSIWKEVKAAIKAAKSEQPPPPVMGDHCDFCPARPGCPAHNQALLTLFGEEEATTSVEANLPAKVKAPSPAEIPVGRLQWVLENAKAIRSFLDGCEDHALKMLQMGQDIDGWKVVAGSSRRRWNKGLPDDQIAGELELLGYEEPWKKALVAMSEVSKELGEEQIAHLVERPEGKPTLAPEKDKRQALVTFEAVVEGDDDA